jgi:hypothetical protein
MRPAAATLGLSPDAMAGGIADLVKLKLVSMDHGTGELFICDWFRYHKFGKPIAQKSLLAAIKKIQSETLKNEISIKSAGCFPTSTTAQTAGEKEQGVSPQIQIATKTATCSPTSTSTSTSTSTKDLKPLHSESAPLMNTPPTPQGDGKGEAPRLNAVSKTQTPAEIARLATDNPSLSIKELRMLSDRLFSESEARL